MQTNNRLGEMWMCTFVIRWSRINCSRWLRYLSAAWKTVCHAGDLNSGSVAVFHSLMSSYVGNVCSSSLCSFMCNLQMTLTVLTSVCYMNVGSCLSEFVHFYARSPGWILYALPSIRFGTNLDCVVPMEHSVRWLCYPVKYSSTDKNLCMF